MLIDRKELERLLEDYTGGVLPVEKKRWVLKLVCGQVEIMVHDLLRELAGQDREQYEPFHPQDRDAL